MLYLVKLSRPELASPVRELSKFMDKATEVHKSALERTIQYVINTKNEKLFMHADPKLRGVIEAYTDSNYASDRDTRSSVSGFAIYVNGCLVSWRSKIQNSVTLLSTEAEYVAVSQCVAELGFVKQILEGLQQEVELPMILKVDNTGAIELTKNWSTSTRTKHIDVQMHYIRELTEQGIIKVEFVRSGDNMADNFTKNLP